MPNNHQRMASNFAALIVGNLFRIVSFAATPYIAWKLGPTAYGQFSSALVVALAAGFVMNFGLDALLVREVARASSESSALFGDANLLKLSAVPIGLIGVLILSLISPGNGWFYLSFLLYSVLSSYVVLISAALRGLERMTLAAAVQAAQLCLVAIASVLAVYFVGTVLAVGIAHVVATAAVLAAGYGLLYRVGLPPRYAWQPTRWLALLRTALPFALAMMGLILFDRQGAIMIAWLSGATAAGWFNIVYNLVLVISNISTVTVNLLFPIFARRVQESRQAVVGVVEAGMKFLNIISAGCAVWLFAHASLLIPLLFGPAYLNAAPLLRVTALAIPCTFLVLLLIAVLQTTDRQHACAVTIGVSMPLMTPVYLLAIRLGGYYGGALAYLGGYVALTIALLWLVLRTLPGLSLRRSFLPPLAAGIGMALVFAVGRSWPLIVTNLVALLCFGALLVLTGGIGKQERAVLRGLLQRWPQPMPSNAPVDPPVR